jgi:hypothetical protein
VFKDIEKDKIHNKIKVPFMIFYISLFSFFMCFKYNIVALPIMRYLYLNSNIALEQVLIHLENSTVTGIKIT